MKPELKDSLIDATIRAGILESGEYSVENLNNEDVLIQVATELLLSKTALVKKLENKLKFSR